MTSGRKHVHIKHSRSASVSAATVAGTASVPFPSVSGGTFPPPAALWSADFESGVYGDYLDQNATWNWPSPASAPIVTTAQKYAGTRSCKFTIPGGGNRCEGILSSSVGDFSNNEDLWFSICTRPEGVENTSNWQLGGVQWKNDGYGSPPISLAMASGRYMLDGGWGYPGSYTSEPAGSPSTHFSRDLSTPVVNNTWYRWVFHILFSTNPAVGTVDIWRDGTQVLTNYKPPGGTLYPVTVDSYFKIGYYRSTSIPSTGSIYIDNVAIGTSAASVGGV